MFITERRNVVFALKSTILVSKCQKHYHTLKVYHHALKMYDDAFEIPHHVFENPYHAFEKPHHAPTEHD